MGPIGKPEDVSPTNGKAVTDDELALLLKKLQQTQVDQDPVVELFKRLGAIVRPETIEEREARLRSISLKGTGADVHDAAKMFMLRQVTDEEFQTALNETQNRYDHEMWPQVSARAWRLFRRLRGDLRDGRTELTVNPDGTVSPKNLAPMPQFLSVREFRPKPKA